MSQPQDLEALMVQMLAAAGRCASGARLDAEWVAKLSDRAALISKNAAKSRLNVFLFHQTVPKEASVISTPDIKGLDHGAMDYESLLRLNISIALWSNPNCRILLFTDKTFLANYPEHPRVYIIRLDLAAAEPMFERVVTMAAYVASQAFTAPTIFLDSDAFLIRPLATLFNNEFDVAVTYRDNPGMMPINEGVIFANDLNLDATRRFFERYLATYLQLEKSPDVVAAYGNIRRWRGGQLSINGISGARMRYARSSSETLDGATKLAYLPCSQHNLSDISESEIVRGISARSSVIHLKGNRKSWINSLINALKFDGFTDSQQSEQISAKSISIKSLC